MTKNELMNTVSRSIHKVGFKFKKNSPELLMITGGIGVIVSTVMACKATLKVNEVITETKTDLERIHTATENGCTEMGKEYTPKDANKDLVAAYGQAGIKFVKLYGLPVALGTLSMGAMVTSNRILHSRNAKLAGAYVALDTAYKELRGRLAERFGEDFEKELIFNIKAKEIEEAVVNEDGTESTVTRTISVIDDPNNYSIYARVYDDGCTGWTKDPEHNLVFLKQQQNWANEKLKSKGYLYLNEVYEMLGIPRSKAGHVVGWIYDEKNPVGDNFVDFGIFNTYSQKARDFVNGYERTIILDFNVDGNIWEMM